MHYDYYDYYDYYCYNLDSNIDTANSVRRTCGIVPNPTNLWPVRRRVIHQDAVDVVVVVILDWYPSIIESYLSLSSL